MPARGGAMHVVTTRRQYKDKVYETTLLRRSYREGGKVRNETLANLSHLPAECIEVIRRQLRGSSRLSERRLAAPITPTSPSDTARDALVSRVNRRRPRRRRRRDARTEDLGHSCTVIAAEEYPGDARLDFSGGRLARLPGCRARHSGAGR